MSSTSVVKATTGLRLIICTTTNNVSPQKILGNFASKIIHLTLWTKVMSILFAKPFNWWVSGGIFSCLIPYCCINIKESIVLTTIISTNVFQLLAWLSLNLWIPWTFQVLDPSTKVHRPITSWTIINKSNKVKCTTKCLYLQWATNIEMHKF